MQDFRQIKVWQKAHSMTLVLYEVTKHFPSDERFGLTMQMRRSAISIGSNIAEGAGRGSDRDFARFLQIAFGSASELEYQIFLSKDLEFISNDSFDDLIERISDVKRMLSAFLNKLTADS